jgi:hypothetical protein
MTLFYKYSNLFSFFLNKGANLPFPACNEDARATRPSTADDEINTEISNNVFKTYSDLQELVKRLGELFQKLTTTLEYSEQVDRYVEEGTKLTTVIQDLAEEMTGNQLDVYATVCPISSDTMEQFLEQDKMISQKVSCLEVEPLLASMHQVSSQIKESGCDSIDQNSLNAVSTEMLKLYQDLNVLSTDHSARVQAVKDRLAWETKLDHLANSLTSVQEDIRELMNEKSIWISKDQVDHQDKTLDDFSARLAIHDKNVVHYAEEVLSELTHAFQKMEASYLDLKTGPPFFLNRQNEIEKLVAKTQDMIKLQMSEVAFLKMRHDWECKADVELKQCNDLDEKTESFIQETARWSTRSKDTSGIDEIHGAIQKQVQSIQVLQNELAQLQTSSVREQNTLLLTEVTFKKKSALEQAITRIENHEEFAKSILEQSAIISTCIDQVDKLEATAETTKSRFLAANGKNDALDSELQSYKESVKQLDQQLDNSLVYPVRHYRDHDPHSREQDVTHNVQVKEIVHARVSRLNELSGTLESILKSKERLSRRRAAEENYMSESKGVLEWIQSKAEVVDGLYQTSSNIAQASSNVDFESLREAVTTAGATQSAISTYNTSVISLKESSSKYIVMIEQHMDGSGNEEAAESIDRITSTQQSVDTAWTQICDRSDAVKYKLLALLRHSEYFKMVDDFKIQCAQLHDTIVSTDTAFATEEVASKWQNQVHSLDSQSLAPIRYRLNDEESKCKQLGEAPELDQMKQLFATATKDFDQLKQILQQHVTDANNARLKNEYFANANDLQSAMNTIQGELDSLKQKSGHICGDEAKDKGEIEKVDNMYSDICARFDPLLEKYDELRSFYRFLQLNKVSNLEDVQQNSLDTAWKQFKSGVANDKNFVDNTHKWFELSSSMASMGSELALMDQHLNSFESIDGDALPDFFQKDASMLVDMNAQLQHFLATTAKLASTYQDSDSTKANAEMFATRLTELKQTLVQTNNLLKEKHDLAQKQVDNLTGQKFVAEVESIVQNELVKMTNRSEAIIQSSPLVEQVYKTSMTGLANTENKQKELNSYLDTIVKPFIVKLDDNQNILDTLSTSSSLLEKEIMSEKRVNDLMRRILGHEKSGDSILNWLESCQQAIQNVYSLVDDASDEHEAEVELFGLSKKMADFEKTIDSFNAITAEMNEKVSIEDSNTDQDSASLGEMKHSVLSHLTNALEQSTNKVQSQWNLVNEELKTVKKTVEKTMKGIAMARKMKSVTSTVGETREIITSLRVFEEVKYGANSDDSGLEDLESRLSDFETASEIGNDENSIKNLGVSNTEIDQADAHKEPEKELQGSHGSSTCVNEVVVVVQPLTSMLRQPEIEDMLLKLNSVEKDSKIQINKEMDEIQEMMTEDMGVTFTRQHLELKESVGNLNVLISNKKLELEKALDIGKYLSATDDVELFQSALEEALIKATPHHATLIGNGVSRTDLHAKLIELDARFKYYESKVVQSLKLAKEVSTKAAQHEEGAEVSSHLEELQSKWNTIKKKHKTRKIELSRAVDTSADPKDQQARIRKSSLPTRKASSLLRDRADLTLARHSRMSPTNSSTSTIRTTPSISGRLTASSSSSSSSSSFMHSPGRTTSSRFLAPPGHQPSKSATHLKTKSRTTVKKPLNTYVADPQNDLDIEIGRIVNETPYRVKVKMVPGEVGRYWFGNHNPKLAYCRVLKSKMVMVRVGGGWTELSQFLRDHALLEGDFIPRTANSIPEEDEGSKSIQEGFIETRRAQLPSGKPIPRHRSVSPNTQRVYPTGTPSHSTGTQNAGYKDGDKYIAVDHHGNQLEVKMRPVPANIHDIARKSNNNYTNRRIARRKEKRAAS